MSKKNLKSISFFISGILFFISAIVGKDFIDILLGCNFIILGISERKKEN